jgi:hypothetical protein
MQKILWTLHAPSRSVAIWRLQLRCAAIMERKGKTTAALGKPMM